MHGMNTPQHQTRLELIIDKAEEQRRGATTDNTNDRDTNHFDDGG